ncbi:alpha-L-fucosidase [candidate division KSB1 bacterium]|nr:alpha-L-fucosidase [candidate division KSB1 bacterium]
MNDICGHILSLKSLAALLCFVPILLLAQYNPDEVETDPLVLRNLQQFQNQKFGLMMHWGPYCQWGVVESWSICSEDEPWCSRGGRNYIEYVRDYENLKKSFNPLRFDPHKWARAAHDAGMRYLVFTTKHHDGFCMFDSKYTDYKITDPQCPFHIDARANITREIFSAFRRRGFMIGAYFSKPDWHHPDYWAKEWATPDRNVNYDPAKYPQRWKRFCEFTYNQIQELLTDYGRVDILWLDGGWVRPSVSITDDIKSWAGMKPYDQDIHMDRIADMARRLQPGLIMVDRTVTGKYENYRTPEQQIPEQPLDYPWETCMTMGSSWSFNPGDSHKSARQLIHTLVEIVAKGGNFLLNVGPDPTGEWPAEAYDRLERIGRWMRDNSPAIYNSAPFYPYKKDAFAYTALQDGRIHAVYLVQEGEAMPAEIDIPAVPADTTATIELLGYAKPLTWRTHKGGITVVVPPAMQKSPPNPYAWTLRITPAK